MKKKKIKGSHVVVYVVTVLLMMIFIIPLAYVVLTSLKTPQEFTINPTALNFTPTFQSFITAWEKINLDKYLFNSVFYTLTATLISVAVSVLVAFPMARGYVKHAGFLSFFFLLGLFLPDGKIPLFQIFMNLGIYGTRFSYILTLLTIGGMPIMMLTSYFKGIPKDLDEAAIIDGCGYFRYFSTVAVPLAKPCIVSVAMLIAIPAWNDISRATVFLVKDEMYPVAQGLNALSGMYTVSYTELAAAMFITSIPLILVYVCMQRYIVDGLTAGSVKM